jgi:hypothetical protein
MTSPPLPSIRWQLLTNRLELQARWRAFCNDLVRRTSPDPVRKVLPVSPVAVRNPAGVADTLNTVVSGHASLV